MEAVATLFKVTLPGYLSRLPIPHSVSGFSELSGSDWFHLSVMMLTVGMLLYAVVRVFHPKIDKGPKGLGHPINHCIKKDSLKVVNLIDIEEIDKEKVSFCRCWKSSKFPYCDGSHNAHNEETGDNVGPLVVKKSK